MCESGNCCESPTLEWLNDYIVLGILFVIAGLIVVTTLYLFLIKKSDERPGFVQAQMILLNVYWILFVFSFFALNGRESERAKHISNTVATLADVCLIVCDWIFTEQYLSAALLFPLALLSQ